MYTAYDLTRRGMNAYRRRQNQLFISQRSRASLRARRPSYHRTTRGRSYKGVDPKFLKNYLRITESKFINTTVSATPVAGTSVVSLLNGVATGDTDVLRDGENILITSLQYNLRVTADKDLVTGQVCRFMLVLKKDVRGAALTVGTLLITDDVLSMRQIINSKNFKILHQINFVFCGMHSYLVLLNHMLCTCL